MVTNREIDNTIRFLVADGPPYLVYAVGETLNSGHNTDSLGRTSEMDQLFAAFEQLPLSPNSTTIRGHELAHWRFWALSVPLAEQLQTRSL